MSHCVYMATCRDSGKSYIGKTKDRAKRWSDHVADALAGRGYAFHAAIRKHGVDAFDMVVLEECESESESLTAEQYWIEWYATMAPCGYNLTAGGESGTHSDEVKARIGAASRGRFFSEEARRKISEAGRGRSPSAETRAKISAAHKGRRRSAESIERMRAAQSGKVLTPEHREKISNGGRGLKRSAETRAKISEALRLRHAKARGES